MSTTTMKHSEDLYTENFMKEFDYLPRRSFGAFKWSHVTKQIARFTCPHPSCNMSVPVTASSFTEYGECPECGNIV